MRVTAVHKRDPRDCTVCVRWEIVVGGGRLGVFCLDDAQEKREGLCTCPPGRYGGVGGAPSLGTGESQREGEVGIDVGWLGRLDTQREGEVGVDGGGWLGRLSTGLVAAGRPVASQAELKAVRKLGCLANCVCQYVELDRLLSGNDDAAPWECLQAVPLEQSWAPATPARNATWW